MRLININSNEFLPLSQCLTRRPITFVYKSGTILLTITFTILTLEYAFCWYFAMLQENHSLGIFNKNTLRP